jgi:type IV pilus assembly protein PilB
MRLKRLGEILVETGRVPPAALAEALREQREHRRPLGEVLLSRNLISRQELLKCLAEQLHVAPADPAHVALDPALIEALPYEIAMRHKAVAIGREGPYVVCAMADPLNVLALDELEARFGCRVAPRIALPEDVDKAIDRAYGRQGAAAAVAGLNAAAGGGDALNAPAVAFVNRMMVEALRREASDIHVEPDRTGAVLRYRIDGVLRQFAAPPADLLPAIVARVKVLSELDLSESRLPQDGRFSFRDGAVEIDVRVATLPTLHGEKLVLRLLPPRDSMRRLDTLGLFPEDLGLLRRLARTPYGILCTTGPSGSGKTTTLYAILDELNTAEKHIVTIEDPVEIDIPGIRQVQVNRRAGLTFASALRSFLRADPNVIMVGEIRDKETLEIALQAALTGHLVLSTLHTNDAAGAIARMLDMGAPPFMVATTLIGAVAQRLVRRVCKECKQEVPRGDPARELLGLPANVKMFAGKGCVNCGGTGYRGRVGLYEVLSIRDQRLESSGESFSDPLRGLAKARPRQTLRDQAIARLTMGETTAEEVVRVTA